MIATHTVNMARLNMLSVLCIAVLAGSALAQTACSTVEKGNVNGPVIIMPPAPLSSGIVDWTVRIPTPVICKYGVAGILVFVCDYDKAPKAQFINEYTFAVHRTGNVQGIGSVEVSVYCYQNGADAKNIGSKLQVNPWEAAGWQKSNGLGPMGMGLGHN